MINTALIILYWRERRAESLVGFKLLFPFIGVFACLGFLLLQLGNL